ncbi:MAG TPA: DUF1990 domain-containing protein [Blastocatellia bacterium]|nr:DUF1990 domain-containing protein [Blastocatellia bacterium]
MILLRQPSPEAIAAFLASAEHSSFSYPETGASRSASPGGYNVDHNRVRLGEGHEDFDRAVDAVRNWEMFNIGWVRLFDSQAPIARGSNVAVLARHFGFWSLNAARIVYVIDEDGPVARFGFAYGTLEEHVERGEERFTVEWRKDDDEVWYEVFAFSRPNHFLTIAGYPLSRALQKRFASDSKQAMLEAVASRRAAR